MVDSTTLDSTDALEDRAEDDLMLPCDELPYSPVEELGLVFEGVPFLDESTEDGKAGGAIPACLLY